MNRLVVALSLVLVTVGGVACRSPEESSELAAAYSTKSSRGDISFDLTPRMEGENELVIELRANTHRGDLADLELKSLMLLHANGEEKHPAAATELRGHHSSATVRFGVDGEPERFAVTIGPVRSMGEQRFEWP